MSELKSPLALEDMMVERQRCLHIALHFQRSLGWGRTLKHSNKLNRWKYWLIVGCKGNSIPSIKASQGQLLLVVINNLPFKNLANHSQLIWDILNKANVHNSKVIGRIEILWEHLYGLYISFFCNLLIGGCCT
jgi:hypothetical protein